MLMTGTGPVAREQRKLAAILAADVVGYSRLMGRDESGTLARLREHRNQRLEPVLARHGGRLVKLTGDGALAEFPSAVDALGAAIEFQQAMAEANREQPEDTAVVFRIGLHLGDLIVEGDDLYGDGVNIAARLEAEAPPGGIIVSRAVREAVEGRLRAKLHALGELTLKNIERPIRAFGVEWDEADWQAAATSPARHSEPDAPNLPLPEKPSIAVLPFQNMSGDPEQEYFTEGVTEDIITELSRFHSLFVIARNSSFSYKGKSPDIRQVGRELGVRYVLEGSIRKSSNRIRVTGQLIDTFTGNHIWAERYDRVLTDIFEVQAEVTQAIVAAIAPQIESTERRKAARRPGRLTAYELALRAWAHAYEGQDKADGTTLKLAILEAQQALAIDPDCVRALHAFGYAHGNIVFLQLSQDPDEALRQAMSATARAIELDSSDAFGYAQRAVAIVYGNKIECFPEALVDIRRAHELNPNDARILRVLCTLEVSLGAAEAGIQHGYQALRLNPRDPRIYATHSHLGFACFAAGRYAEGIDWNLRAVSAAPDKPVPRAYLAACFVGAGEIDKAKAAFAIGQQRAPGFFKARLEGSAALARRKDRNRFQTFLRIAAGLEDPSAAEPLR